jgi:hypothetical protein
LIREPIVLVTGQNNVHWHSHQIIAVCNKYVAFVVKGVGFIMNITEHNYFIFKHFKYSEKFFSSEYPYKFVKVLKSQQITEKDQVNLLCELDDAGGEVTWHKNNEPVKPDKR